MPTRPLPVFTLAAALAVSTATGSGITLLAGCGDRAATPPSASAPAAKSALSGAELSARVTEILAHTDSLQRVTQLSALLSTLDPSAVAPVTKAFDAAPLDVADPELLVLAIWWARFDPQAALEWVTPHGRVRSGTVVATVFRTWAHSDPELALGTARTLAFHLHRDVAVDAAIVGWDESGKPGLVESFQQLNDADVQRLSDSLARRRVAALGPEGAFRWVETFASTPRFQQIVAERVASSAAESAKGAPIAAAWATPRVRSDDRLSNFPRRIATRWVAHDPKAAMAWLATLPAGADRYDGVTEAFRDWMGYDRAAASAWIESVEIEEWNESALAFYARTIAPERPKEAMEKVQRVRDPEVREGAMILIARAWMQADPAAAQAWLAQPGLPERVRRVSARVAGNAARAQAPAPPTNMTPAPAAP